MKKKVTAPKKTTVRGQPHKLAYINDQEEGLLMALGGTGELVHGIPAFIPDDGNRGGGDFSSAPSGPSSSEDTSEGNNGFTPEELAAGAAARAAIDAHNKQVAAGLRPNEDTTDYTPYFTDDRINNMLQQNQQALANQVARSFVDYAGVFAPSIYSSNVYGRDWGKLLEGQTWKNALAGKGFNLGGTPMYSSWFDDPLTRKASAQIGIDQMKGRMEQSRSGKLGKVFGGPSNFFQQNVIDKLEAGGRPVFDANGNIQGVFHEQKIGDFSLGEVYSGNPVEGLPETGWGAGGNDAPDVKPVNELTGTCEEGYVFDEDLQACRLATGGGSGSAGGGNFGVSGETYYRPNALDTAPANIPAYMGPNYNYNQANKNFVQTYAYNPDYYENQMDITGFAPVSGILV